MDFSEFCKKTAEHLGLQLVPMKEGAKAAHTYAACRKNPEPKMQVTFEDMSSEGIASYLAEIHDIQTRLYLGAIGMEAIDKAMFEHYETGVSPDGNYDENNRPIGESQLWRYYYGNSLKRACDSFLKGGARTGREPIKVW